MATIVLGCDENNGPSADAAFQNAVAAKLEKAGHKVEKLSIAPGAFASYSYGENGENPHGKIGVYLIAAGITSIADLYDGNTGFKYGYIGIRGDVTDSMKTIDDFNNKPISKDWHGDCISRSCNSFAGKTFPQMNEVVKNKLLIVFGATGDEMGDNIIKAMGGEIDSDNKKAASNGSTIKEALKKAVSKWDGDVEIRLEDDTVYVNKIPDPSTAKITIDEYNNAFYDSITVTDVNPETINKLVLKFKEYVLTIQDDTLIKRFGEKKETCKIDKTVKTLKQAKAFLQREWNKIRRDDGRQVELKVNGSPKWKTGIWCRVYFPSYFIDDYMYISKTSSDEDSSSNWNTSITLVDYPPSFGAYVEETEEEDTTVDDATAEVTA